MPWAQTNATNATNGVRCPWPKPMQAMQPTQAGAKGTNKCVLGPRAQALGLRPKGPSSPDRAHLGPFCGPGVQSRRPGRGFASKLQMRIPSPCWKQPPPKGWRNLGNARGMLSNAQGLGSWARGPNRTRCPLDHGPNGAWDPGFPGPYGPGGPRPQTSPLRPWIRLPPVLHQNSAPTKLLKAQA